VALPHIVFFAPFFFFFLPLFRLPLAVGFVLFVGVATCEPTTKRLTELFIILCCGIATHCIFLPLFSFSFLPLFRLPLAVGLFLWFGFIGLLELVFAFFFLCRGSGLLFVFSFSVGACFGFFRGWFFWWFWFSFVVRLLP